MNAQEVRNPVDTRMAAELAQDPQVQAMQEAMEGQGGNTRRSLLAQALRLTPQVAPELHKVIAQCVERLEVETDLEVYVYAAPQFNAGCTSPENGRVFVLLTASLLEAFDTPELAFVLGHELGHHVYEHHEIPLQALAQQRGVAPRTILQGHAWLRQAELSADRAGLLCCADGKDTGLDSAVRSFFKLSSGMSRAPGPKQVAAYMEQSADLYREDSQKERKGFQMDWLSTHPFSPVRIRALKAFSESEAMGGTEGMLETEAKVQSAMGLMEPSYLEEDSPGAEAMRRLLFAAGAVVAGADGEVTEDEIAALASLLGEGRVPRTLNPERLAEVLPERIQMVIDLVSVPKRVQLIRDLTLIAKADGGVDNRERFAIRELAQKLGVQPSTCDIAIEETGCLD